MSRQASVRKQPRHLSGRFYFVMAAILLVFGVLLGRSAYLQVLEPEQLQLQGDLRSLRQVETHSRRGMILDRNGEPLAVSVPVQTVWADNKIVHDKNALAMAKHWQALADVLDVPLNVLLERVSDPRRRFVFLKRRIAPAAADYVRQLKIPGIYLKQESRRFYPSGEVTAQLVGVTNVDDKGIEGLELKFDRHLQGSPGYIRYRKDAKGRRVEVLERVEAVQPQDIYLTLDKRIQTIAYRALKAGVETFRAKAGAVVVVDVRNGEVLAMANAPSFNPNDPSQWSARRLRNRAITDAFEPGSTMKPFTILSALEFGVARPDTVIDARPLRLGGRRIADPRYYGKIDLRTIIRKSSNAGVSRLALQIPTENFLMTFFDAGFGSPTGIELVGESAGQFGERRRWSDSEKASLSFGYGLTVTTAQLASAYATLASGGIRRPLHLIKGNGTAEQERVFSRENSRRVLEMMAAVVEKGGTGHLARVDGYQVAGKTGTVRKAVAGGYGDDYIALFAGIAPLSEPRLAVVVMIDEPGGDYYHGGEVAAPIFSRIVGNVLPLLNVRPDDDPARMTAIQLPLVPGGGNG